jgi:hypothetical protein
VLRLGWWRGCRGNQRMMGKRGACESSQRDVCSHPSMLCSGIGGRCSH